MPYKNAATRLKVKARSMRRRRIYDAAVAAGTPESKEAERWRNLDAGIDLICAEDPEQQRDRIMLRGKPTYGMVRLARKRFRELRGRAIDAYIDAYLLS